MRNRPPWMLPVVLCVGGLVMAHHPMMKDGLGWIQFDPGDTRFCNYVLEHGFRWATLQPGHRELWSPPFFFRSEGHLAWSENLLGTMPVYAVWRLVGFPFDTAFQLWVLSIGVLNFTAMYFFLRRCVAVDTFAASVGAVLFAFAGVRINQTMHWHLFPHFFTVLALHAVWRLVGDSRQLSERSRVWWLSVFGASVVGQFWASVYLGWFVIFGLSFAAVLGLVLKEGRSRIWFLIRESPFAIGLVALGSAAALLPIATHYLGAQKLFGGRPWGEVMTMIPPPQAWFHFGNWSWWYRATNDWPIFASIPMQHEQRLGFGLLTSALCLAGLWTVRHQRGLRFFGILLVLLIVCTTLWGSYPTGFTIWKVIWTWFPGAKAIRGVSRIALLYLIGVSTFVSVALQQLKTKTGKVAVAAIPLGLLAMIEQGETTAAFSKQQARADVADISEAIGPECQAFFFSAIDGAAPVWKYQLDAMMAGLNRGLPTLNGYSGQLPPGWEILGEPGIRSPQDEQRNSGAAQRWINQQQIQERVCWAKVALQEGPLRARFVSQTVPSSMIAGQRVQVTLGVRNEGEQPWDPGQDFMLGSQAPRDGSTWGLNRVRLPKIVRPGEEAQLSFEVTAPNEPGRYPFQWRMLQERVTWFGKLSPAVEVEVRAGP